MAKNIENACMKMKTKQINGKTDLWKPDSFEFLSVEKAFPKWCFLSMFYDDE